MQINGFPNLITIAGPQSGSASTNYPRGIEVGVDWATGLLTYARERGYTRMEATHEAEQQWSDHVAKMYATMLMRKAKGWFTGYNSNVDGHEQGRIRYFVYNGGAPKYRATITDIAEQGYPASCSTGAPGGTTTRPRSPQRSRSSIERPASRRSESDVRASVPSSASNACCRRW